MLPADYYDSGECPEVPCMDCGEQVLVTSAEWDRAMAEWICDSCLYGNEEDDEDEDELAPAAAAAS